MSPALIDPTTTDLLVLDVHGVIFNNPLPRFLHDLGVHTGEGGDALLAPVPLRESPLPAGARFA